nr:arabinofuranosidase [uncultured Rhodococcus sp.]
MVLLAVAGLLFAATGTGAAAPSAWRYTMVAFSNDSDRDMDVYQSSDGTDFAALQTSAYRPPSGVVRDASIFRHTDGMYYVTYTTGGGAEIGFARSTDRVNWTFVQNLPIPFCCLLLPGTGAGTGSAGSSELPSLSPFTTKAWAPEWFVEGDRVSIIVSLSAGGGFVPYLMTATDPGLTTWSSPVPLTGIINDHIDTTVVKAGALYHAFTKGESDKVIEHWTAPSLSGPYVLDPTFRDLGPLKEGPAVVELPDGTWRLYYDDYTNQKYFYSDSRDMVGWSEPKELPGLSGTVRHVGVMREAV